MPAEYEILIVGTSPSSEKGGISSALEGYFQGIKELNIAHCHISTHAGADGNSSMLKRWFYAGKQLKKEISRVKSAGKQPIVWLHPGAWLSLFRKFSLGLIARVLGAKVLIQIHSNSYLTYLNHPVLKYYALLMISPAHRVIALTPWWQNKLREYTNKPISVVPNAITQELLSIANSTTKRQEESVDGHSTINILTMSRLVKGKGFESVIRTMQKLPEHFHLNIAGDGELKAALESLVNENNLSDRVHFLGWISGQDKIQHMKNADVFCLPSSNDSFGMVYIEAMSCRLPIVSLDFGPVNHIVKHEVSGIVSPSLLERDLANAITQAIDKKETITKEGLKQVIEQYSPAIVATQLQQTIEECCNEH